MVFSWQMAEELAAAHMRSIGFPDARRTRDGADGGIDVTATSAVAQVKYQTAPVGGPAIQRLRGAAHRVKHAIFYASNGYTAAALATANETDVALFTYTETNKVTPANDTARRMTAPENGDSRLAWVITRTQS